MNPVIYNEFKNLLDRLNQEKDDIEKQISDNTLQIIEAKSYAKEILDREEEDFKVFSPRKIEDIYKEELEKSHVKQSDYENRNRALISRREKLDSVLLVLENVWEEINVKESDKVSEDVSIDENELSASNDEIDTEVNSDENINKENHIDEEQECDGEEKCDSEQDDSECMTDSNFSDDIKVEEVVEDIFSKATEKTIKDTVKKLNQLFHRIELNTKFIHQDPMRVKIELEDINKNIKKVTDKLSSVIDK